MARWLRRFARFVERRIEYPLTRLWTRVRDYLYPPPVFLGPQPTVDFVWRRIRDDMAEGFTFAVEEFEFLDHTPPPDDTSR